MLILSIAAMAFAQQVPDGTFDTDLSGWTSVCGTFALSGETGCGGAPVTPDPSPCLP